MNDIVQYIIVGLVLAYAAYWIAKRVFSKKKDCDCGCQGCPLADKCSKDESKRTK